jgi:hypothetical protein
MAEDSTSRKRLKKKVLDRWENEGGRICTDSTTAIKSDQRKKRARKDNTAQTSESLKADSPNEFEKTK